MVRMLDYAACVERSLNREFLTPQNVQILEMIYLEIYKTFEYYMNFKKLVYSNVHSNMLRYSWFILKNLA